MDDESNIGSIEIFCGYSHKDRELTESLVRQLKRDHIVWYDREIGAGQDWAKEIDSHLNTADVILLLISPDFMASDYCYRKEMKRALERQKIGEVLVIPILVRSVDWEGNPLRHLQALPTNLKSVTSWENRDEALADIIQGIRKAINQIYKERYLTEAKNAVSANQLPEACAAYERAIHHIPEDAHLQNGLGNVLFMQKNFEEALRCYKNAIILKPENSIFYINQGDAYFQLHRLKESLKSYEDASKRDKGDFRIYDKMAKVFFLLEHYEDAVEAYNKAIYLQNNKAYLYINQGNALFKLKKYNEALKIYDKALSLDVRDVQSYIGKVNIYLAYKKYNSALDIVEKAIQLEPDNAQLWRKKGQSLTELDRLEEAENAYVIAVKWASEDVDICRERENILAKLERLAEAQATYAQTLVPSLVSSLEIASSNALSPGTPLSGNVLFKTKSKRNSFIFFMVILIVLAIIFPIIGPLIYKYISTKTSINHYIITLGVYKASDDELIGINDGSFPSFVSGPDGSLKQQAVNQLKQGHGRQAVSLWQAALHISNNDAEAWIYLENQLVLFSGQPYITLVAGTDLFESSGSGQYDLQGIYVAQHEFNNASHGFRLRILIANSGTDINNVTTVAQRIVNIAKRDKTVVGVISWLNSAENITALPFLSAAHIPMISPTASIDALTNASPFFFRIVFPNRVQGSAEALFAEHALHAHEVVVFIDNNDPSSLNLSGVFEKQFTQDGGSVLKEEFFITNHTHTIESLIQDALKANPDLLYFTSRDTSDVINFENALPTSGSFTKTPALAGDAGYAIRPAGYGRWYFASFAFAGELNNVPGKNAVEHPFYQEYSDAFNQDDRKLGGYYGYTRPDNNAMLSYDVTSVFTQAMLTAMKGQKISDGLQHLTSSLLASTLPHVAFQGVSGWIAFDSTGNPIKKAFVFLAVSPDGYIYMKDWLGCFTQTLCRNAS